ncbi:MAG: methionyl-tRNA formyltransferase [Puniceicoccales bacterium]|nr:methionyl-tRNA formyltransferase [Puniceicoccales bacterium]
MIRLVFFGSDEIALPCLESIAAEHGGDVALAAIYSQPDRPSGRGQKLQPNAIAAWGHARGLPVFQPERLDGSEPDALRTLGCDLAIVMAYGHILKRRLLETPVLGFFNLHASLLPLLRGASPIESAIAAGVGTSGVSLQRMVSRLDAGPVVDAEPVPLAGDETRLSLRAKIAEASVPLMRRTLPRLLAGDSAGVPQDDSAATFTRKITREDAAVDFRATAAEIAARVRALSPWPGVTVPWHDGLVLKIGEAVSEPALGTDGAPPGKILAADGHGVCIATGGGVLRVLQMQRPTGKMLPCGAFLAGFPMPAGTVLESRVMPAMVR